MKKSPLTALFLAVFLMLYPFSSIAQIQDREYKQLSFAVGDAAVPGIQYTSAKTARNSYCSLYATMVVTDMPNEAVGEGGNLLRVWVQTSGNGGTTWNDIIRFDDTTTLGARVARVHCGNIDGTTDTTIITEGVPTDATLGSGTDPTQGPFGNTFRVAYVSSGSTAAHDFTVSIFLM